MRHLEQDQGSLCGLASFTVGCLGVVLDEDKRVLLVRTEYAGNRWHLPGGYVESRETPDNALRREFIEELGIQIVISGFRGVYFKAYSNNLSLIFQCAIAAGTPKPDGHEVLDCGYFAADSYPASLSHRTRTVIERALASERQPFVLTFRTP